MRMPEAKKTVAIVNGTGRQAASVIRAVTSIGWNVRAQVYSLEGLVAEELADLPGVTLFEGSLIDNQVLIDTIFEGAQLAFINTFPNAGDEVRIGKALANAAKKRGIQHYIYSSMPDHSVHNPSWPGLPMWAPKFMVENYIRQLGLPATFTYAGIYNNNFTSLPYPLFCMDFRDDGTVEWRAPFHPDTKLPWLDAEHDVGPAVLQIFKQGLKKWGGHRQVSLPLPLITCQQDRLSSFPSPPLHNTLTPVLESPWPSRTSPLTKSAPSSAAPSTDLAPIPTPHTSKSTCPSPQATENSLRVSRFCSASTTRPIFPDRSSRIRRKGGLVVREGVRRR